ncbi:MAG: hypothetical protein IMF00_01875, partial [Proteobacteria bacterium]|nr:hypothetical protein [Pseudomonadota bacterium]
MISTRRMKLLSLLLVVCCLAVGCATAPPISINEAIADGEDEKILWRRAREEQQVINNSGLLYKDAELKAYLDDVAKKLQAYTNSPDISFDIKV